MIHNMHLCDSDSEVIRCLMEVREVPVIENDLQHRNEEILQRIKTEMI